MLPFYVGAVGSSKGNVSFGKWTRCYVMHCFKAMATMDDGIEKLLSTDATNLSLLSSQGVSAVGQCSSSTVQIVTTLQQIVTCQVNSCLQHCSFNFTKRRWERFSAIVGASNWHIGHKTWYLFSPSFLLRWHGTHAYETSASMLILTHSHTINFGGSSFAKMPIRLFSLIGVCFQQS